MGYSPQYREPDTVTAGDTWTWKKSLSDYAPSDGWSLTYYFSSNGQTPQTVTASGSGSDFTVTIAATTTATWPDGDWYWTAKASKGSEVYTVESGRFVVNPNPATFTGDPRSMVKRTLDAIRACIYGTAAKDEGSMTVDGVALSLRSIDELRRLEASYAMKYRVEVSQERGKRGLSPSTKIRVQFSRPL